MNNSNRLYLLCCFTILGLLIGKYDSLKSAQHQRDAKCYGKSLGGNVGTGNASTYRYWYNENKCQSFIYGGRGLSYETDNIFKTKVACCYTCSVQICEEDTSIDNKEKPTLFQLTDYELEEFVGQKVNDVRNKLERLGYLVYVVRRSPSATEPPQTNRVSAIITYSGADNRVTKIVQRTS
ncbi:unnamed protein product [Didymodactylos carnosus]|uniref:BPTI/Kunitz inhibitor domain-containing protein n=1 Tax=Didymodactylos carnosus TaxID=1234261 RepID=A0A815HI86_9BILA|nr:unnamed protein product [Didymodactylos carnosus]CAF1351101.1 unnamed protein product [Didymodactylos carnosus]CAF3863150.1 unnamed protein product [Didymodactylos carnosus]CAF4221168.1 unnamed protein product [Didymodactylos carnosus]